MRTKYLFAMTAAALLIPLAAYGAPNQTVTLTVPVDLSAIPYITQFSVQCWLMESADQGGIPNGAAFNRADVPVSNGEYHGSVKLPLTAPQGQTLWGYHCNLYLYASGEAGGFTPVAANDAKPSDPATHVAAPGTPLVTSIQAPFNGPSRVMHMPMLMH